MNIKSQVFLAALMLASISAQADKLSREDISLKPVKNLIIMIPDGTSIAANAIARWYTGGSPFAMDKYACGLVRTYSANAQVTDSAASATTYATGFKTCNGYLGVMPDKTSTVPAPAKDDFKRPVANIMEGARLKGKSTGIIATCDIVDATPGAFSAHVEGRKLFDPIAEQMSFAGFDLVLGGGEKYFRKDVRKDKEDMLEVIKNSGFEIVRNTEDMKKSSSKKLWGFFSDGAMAWDWDRNPEKEPSLEEMTAKAISVLSENKNGFVLMVEASKVDWSCHGNDPAGMISEFLAFEKAVRYALDFASKDGNTAIIIMTDHGNGGISMIGDISALKKVKLTNESVKKKLKSSSTDEEIKAVFADDCGITNLSKDEIEAFRKSIGSNPEDLKEFKGEFSKIISKRCNVGWSTGGHSGEDVTLFCYAPDLSNRPYGLVENTDIAHFAGQYIGLKLSDLNDELFVPASKLFEGKAELSEDNSDSANPVLIVKSGSKTIKFPVNRNYAETESGKVTLPSVTVKSPTAWYLSRKAADLIAK